MPGLKAAFLDRDGTLIESRGFVNSVSDLVASKTIHRGVSDAHWLMTQGYELVLVTNQGGVGLGYLSVAMHEAIMREFQACMWAMGLRFSGMYACIHAPSAGCDCRKPKPGMLLQAATDLGIDLSRSIMIGDRPEDVAAGEAAGCRYSLSVAGGWEALDLEKLLA